MNKATKKKKKHRIRWQKKIFFFLSFLFFWNDAFCGRYHYNDNRIDCGIPKNRWRNIGRRHEKKWKSLIVSHFIASIKCDCNRNIDQFIETKEIFAVVVIFCSKNPKTIWNNHIRTFRWRNAKPLLLYKINTKHFPVSKTSSCHIHTNRSISFHSVPFRFHLQCDIDGCCYYCKWPTTQYSMLTYFRGHRKRRTFKENVELK